MLEDEDLFHDRDNISRCETGYYFCHCDKLANICRGDPTQNRWFGLGHFGTTSGLRQPNEMKTRQRWILITFVVAAALVLLFIFSTGGGGSGTKGRALNIHMDLDKLTERGKCPACFGVNLCPQMLQGKIKLTDWTKYSLTKLVNQKNVFYADWQNKKLMLKKLAHDNELEDLDKTICERRGHSSNCDVSSSVQYLINEYTNHSEVHPGGEILHGGKIGEGSDILYCPSHRKMDFLISAANKFNKGQHKKTILANVLTMILLNPEPLILQAFPQEEGWPFPTYYGSCGRIVAEEYVGRSLSDYLNEPFLLRARLAVQLLEIANKFGDNPSGFTLYMTDPSPDNFAVREDTHELKMIDLENIIVVDKEQLKASKVKDADKLLVSEPANCDVAKGGNGDGKCFAYSFQDLCTRPLTDHNFFAVCAGILAPNPLTPNFSMGLLHSMPDKDRKRLPQISELLETCKDPSTINALELTRIEAAEKLLHILKDFLQEN